MARRDWVNIIVRRSTKERLEREQERMEPDRKYPNLRYGSGCGVDVLINRLLDRIDAHRARGRKKPAPLTEPAPEVTTGPPAA